MSIEIFGAKTQYTENETDASITGNAVMWEDAADTLRAASAAKPLPVANIGTNSVTVASGSITVGSHMNSTASLYASSQRTATIASSDQTNNYANGALIIVNVTAFSATPSVTPTLQVKDPISLNYTTFWSGTAITNADLGTLPTQFLYYVYPGAVETGGAATVTKAINFALPLTWRMNMVHADADPITYSASANYLM